MASFVYRAYISDGSLEAGVIEATDLRDATRKLAQAGKRAFSVAGVNGEVASGQGSAPWWRLQRRPDTAKLLSELSVLLDAGFNVPAALRIFANAETSGNHRAQLLTISDEIANGKSFSEAISGLSGFSSAMGAMIASGESSGRIVEVISRMAEDHQYRAERRAAILGALVYPAFLIVMVIAAVLFLSLFLMPAIEPVFEQGSAQKPFIVAVFSGLGQFLSGNAIAVICVILISALGFILLLQRPAGRLAIERIFLSLPLVGRLRRENAVATYLHTLSLLLENGVPMTEALRLAASTCAIPDMRSRLATVRDAVANGERFQEICRNAGIFTDATLTLIGIGEESNRLPALLKRASVLVEARVKRTLDRLVTFLTPAITIALGLIVGGLFVSVMTALLSVNEIAVQ
jgi:general secretion pathway protein F